MKAFSEMEKERKGTTFICEHCHEPVYYEFLTPIAVRCDHCDSIFDARLQIAKGRTAQREERKTREPSTND
ncbi:MAG: hypothetical protein ACRECH_14140 [Nitrososphaerales archaeon]